MNPIRTLTGLALLALLSAPGAAAAFNGQFQGGGTISNFNQACRNNNNWPENAQYYVVRYQPAGIGGNPDRDALTFLNDNHAFGFERPSGPFTNAFQPVTHGGVFRQPWIVWHDDPDIAALLRVTARTPANLTANTAASVRLRGQIRNFSGIPNCRVNFDVIVQQRR